MLRTNTKLALLAGNNGVENRFGNQFLFRRNQLELDRLRGECDIYVDNKPTFSRSQRPQYRSSVFISTVFR